MNKLLRTNLTILLGSLLPALLFTHQGWGWNILLYTFFLIGVAYARHTDLRRHPLFWAAGGNLLILAGLWIILDTQLAHILYTLMLWVFIGVVQGPFLRFLWFAGMLGMISTGTAAAHRWLSSDRPVGLRRRPVAYWSAILLIPVTLLLLFFALYLQASSVFASWFTRWQQLGQWLWEYLQPGPYVWFALPGLLLTSALLWRLPWLYRLQAFEARWNDHLVRCRTRKPRSFPMLALKREYLTGLLTLAGLNGLLLLVNLSDIYSLWLGQVPRTPQALSEYVHEGTGYLILSIFLASAIVLVLFRGHLNFYPQGGWLRYLSYLWIAQNAFLALSVGLRNGYYAHIYGLTYLRIGLFFFLVLVIWGLFTLARKIARRHTLYRLLSNNAYGWMVAFTLLAMTNWDVAITRYNLQEVRREHLDSRHLLHLASAKNLPLLEAHREALQSDGYYTRAGLEEILGQERQQLVNHWEGKGPLGQTWQDQLLKKHVLD